MCGHRRLCWLTACRTRHQTRRASEKVILNCDWKHWLEGGESHTANWRRDGCRHKEPCLGFSLEAALRPKGKDDQHWSKSEVPWKAVTKGHHCDAQARQTRQVRPSPLFLLRWSKTESCISESSFRPPPWRYSSHLSLKPSHPIGLQRPGSCFQFLQNSGYPPAKLADIPRSPPWLSLAFPRH